MECSSQIFVDCRIDVNVYRNLILRANVEMLDIFIFKCVNRNHRWINKAN